MMISAIIMLAGQTLRLPEADAVDENDRDVYALPDLSMLMVIFGLLDLQMSNYRDVLFAGAWAGILAAVPDADPGSDAADSGAAVKAGKEAANDPDR